MRPINKRRKNMATQLITGTNKNMMTLEDVSERVDMLSENCFDRLIKTKDISFNHLSSLNIGTEEHYIRPVAQMEVSFRLGIPLQYLKRCPQDVQQYNLNHWIKKERNEELFFRFDGNDVRALFTPKYKPVDNFEVMERLDSLGYSADTKAQCHLDPEFMLLNIPDANKSFSLVKGDEMIPGISICNSEVGLATLTIAAYILRLICTNGLVSTTAVDNKYRHVSRRILDEFPEVLANVSDELTTQKNQLKFSLESLVSDPVSTMASFNRQFQLGEQEREALEWAWSFEMGPAMFHIVQSYTRAAQYEGLSAESSYKLQKVGGTILGMVSKN
jgi:hypothetical protein